MKYKAAKILLGAVLYSTAVSTNYLAHLSEFNDDFGEMKDYPVLSKQRAILLEHSDKHLNELRSPWVLVPGSFLWRKIGEPYLEPTPETKIRLGPIIKA